MAEPYAGRLSARRTFLLLLVSVAGAEGYMTAGEYEDGQVGEVFIKMSKQGSTLAGVMDAFSVSISIGLQYGVPLRAFVSKFTNMRFDLAGMTDDPDIRIAQSVMDYLFRRLALDYLPYDKRAELGIFTAEERATAVAGSSYGGGATSVEDDVDVEALASSVPVEKRIDRTISDAPADRPEMGTGGVAGQELRAQTATDAPLCFTCGVKMRPAGSCYVCESCG